MESTRTEKRPIEEEEQVLPLKKQKTDEETSKAAFAKATSDLIAEGALPLGENVQQLEAKIR